MFLLVLLKVSSQIDASQVNARLNFPLRRFPLGHFSVRRYLFILIQYASYVQFILILKYMYI